MSKGVSSDFGLGIFDFGLGIKGSKIPQATPQDVLLHLIEVRELKQADLVGVIGSKGVVSEVVNGKRAISKAQAKALGEFFKVNPSVFI